MPVERAQKRQQRGPPRGWRSAARADRTRANRGRRRLVLRVLLPLSLGLMLPASTAMATKEILYDSADVAFEATVPSPFKVEWDTGFRPGSSPVKLKFYLYANAGDAMVRYEGTLTAAWEGTQAVPGALMQVLVTPEITIYTATWQSDGYLRYGGRYKISYDFGFKEIKYEDYIPYLPHLDLSWPANSTFNSFALDTQYEVGALQLGATGYCLPIGDLTELFGEIPAGCADESFGFDWDINVNVGSCDTDDWPDEPDGGLTDPDSLEFEVTIRPTPPVAVSLSAKLGFCAALLVGDNQLQDTRTSQVVQDEGVAFVDSVLIPCEFASASPGQPRIYTATVGPYKLDASVEVPLILRVNPVIAACLCKIVEVEVDPNAGICFEVPIPLELDVFSFNEMEADFRIPIVDPLVHSLWPSQDDTVETWFVCPAIVTWGTTWGAPDHCGCQAQVEYRLNDPVQGWGAWQPVNDEQPQANSGQAGWDVPLYADGREAQVRVAMLDPKGRFLHQLEGGVFPVLQGVGSYAVMADTGRTLSVWTLPDGRGDALSHCYTFGGGRADARIMLQVLDEHTGAPFVGVPRDSMWLETSLGGLVLCPRGSIADSVTNTAGITWFELPLRAGGATNPAAGERTVIHIGGAQPHHPLPDQRYRPRHCGGFDIQFNSPDINGDLMVNLTDVVLFAAAYDAGVGYQADYFYDGVVNLSDVVLLALGFATVCGPPPPAGPE